MSQSSFSNYGSQMYTPSLSPDTFEMSRGQIGLRALNNPIDAYLEIVFVHDFMGDSSLSWTYDSDRSMFWPDWLLGDIELSNVRLHTFGFHEPAVNGRAPLSKIREIGQALSNSLDVDSHFRGESSNPIIFVAHSLGGLVAKAAIENAHRVPDLSDLARRIHGVLFLATPHRDTEDRLMLSNILRSSGVSASRYDSMEPEPSTSVLQEINNGFFSCSQDIKLYSFYGNSDRIVDKRRAVMGKSSTSRPQAYVRY